MNLLKNLKRVDYFIYLCATLVQTFAMLPTGVKNRLFFNSVDFSIFKICTQLC